MPAARSVGAERPLEPADAAGESCGALRMARAMLTARQTLGPHAENLVVEVKLVQVQDGSPDRKRERIVSLSRQSLLEVSFRRWCLYGRPAVGLQVAGPGRSLAVGRLFARAAAALDRLGKSP